MKEVGGVTRTGKDTPKAIRVPTVVSNSVSFKILALRNELEDDKLVGEGCEVSKGRRPSKKP